MLTYLYHDKKYWIIYNEFAHSYDDYARAKNINETFLQFWDSPVKN